MRQSFPEMGHIQNMPSGKKRVQEKRGKIVKPRGGALYKLCHRLQGSHLLTYDYIMAIC